MTPSDQNFAQSAAEGAVVASAATRPNSMPMTIQRGMLKTLGINLYANIGKVLVEFIANAYDSDASQVKISLPLDKIEEERARVKKGRKAVREERIKGQETGPNPEGDNRPSPAEPSIEATANAAGSSAEGFDVLLETFPESVQVEIEDDGHGMTWEDVRTKFLPLNRQRRRGKDGRETELLTPVKRRYVMGRKGVGKLAGFGAAEKVVVWTKKEGETYATIITLTDDLLNNDHDMSSIAVPVSYVDGLEPGLHGTKITMSKLKVDSFKNTSTLESTIASSFYGIRSADFRIMLNGNEVTSAVPEYEFIFPSSLSLDHIRTGNLQESTIEVEDIGSIKFRYYVGFRRRGDHLRAERRGARIYCNNRLAAGPSLFDLGTGMHSFHSADYMECVVEADDLDRNSVDLISTSRTQLQEGNDVVDALKARITEIMKEAVKAHGEFRQEKAQSELEQDEKAKIILRTINVLPRKTQKAAYKLLSTIAAQYGVATAEFQELAPIIVHSVNATEVLARLVESGAKSETVATIMSQLRELSEIEKQDTLKLYRGRRGGILKLQALEKQGEELWKQKGLEKELHSLLKENPWLIRPEYSTYVSSDKNLKKLVSRLAEVFEIDEFSAVPDESKRPDLVFLMSDPADDGPYAIRIVELKSPTIPLNLSHWQQLEGYIMDVRSWCDAEVHNRVSVTGFLIGAMPDFRKASRDERHLLEKVKSEVPNDPIKVVGLTQLIKDAWTAHVAAINALERDLAGEDDEAEQGGNESAPSE
jgi:hypothetical protein